MMHSTQTQEKLVPHLHKGDIQCVCEQLKADIDSILSETKDLNEREKFEKLHRLHELKQILSTIEDINHAVDLLLEKQLQKRPSELH